LKKKIVNGNLVNNQGVLLNNYFPALEHPQNFGMMEGGTSQMSEDGGAVKDQRYPKFSTDNINNPANFLMA